MEIILSNPSDEPDEIEDDDSDLVSCTMKQQEMHPAAMRFIRVVTDDLLQEIFLRLPNRRAVIRSTATCKRWHSLVHKYPSFENFVTRFNQYHADKELYSDPTNVFALFRFSPEGFYELRRRTWGPKPYYLSFMRDYSRLVISASCGDLLLLSLDYWKTFICNSVTRQWFVLPNIPAVCRLEAYYKIRGYALVCHSLLSYSVVIVSGSKFYETGEYSFDVVVFDSRTMLWTQTHISLRYRVPREVLLCNVFSTALQVVHTSQGVVHWLDGTSEQIYFVAAFDPLTSESRLIPLPCDGVGDAKGRVRLGVVRGRLRLLLTEEISEVRLRVIVWELEDDAGWTLVHDLFLNVEDAAVNKLFFVLCLDPSDGNVMYLVRGNRICRYEIGHTNDLGICEFPWDEESMDELRHLVEGRLQVLTLVHPPWPTPISLLSSSFYQR